MNKMFSIINIIMLLCRTKNRDNERKLLQINAKYKLILFVHQLAQFHYECVD